MHAMLGLEVPDDGFDGGPAPHLAFDLGCHTPLLTGDEDPELIVGRRVVAAVSLVGDDALDGIADERFHLGDNCCQCVSIIGLAWHCLNMGDELTAFGVR